MIGGTAGSVKLHHDPLSVRNRKGMGPGYGTAVSPRTRSCLARLNIVKTPEEILRNISAIVRHADSVFNRISNNRIGGRRKGHRHLFGSVALNRRRYKRTVSCTVSEGSL